MALINRNFKSVAAILWATLLSGFVLLVGCHLLPDKTTIETASSQHLITTSHCIVANSAKVYGIGILANGAPEGPRTWVVFDDEGIVASQLDKNLITKYSLNVQCWLDSKNRLNFVWPEITDDDPARSSAIYFQYYDFDLEVWSDVRVIWSDESRFARWMIDTISLFVDKNRNAHLAFRRTHTTDDAIVLSQGMKGWTQLIIPHVVVQDTSLNSEYYSYVWSGLPAFMIDSEERYIVGFTHDLRLLAGDNNEHSVYVMRSDDRGEIWQPVQLVHKSNGQKAYAIRMWEEDETIHMIWTEERQGMGYGLGYAFSEDRGVNWNPGSHVALGASQPSWLSQCREHIVVGEFSGRTLAYTRIVAGQLLPPVEIHRFFEPYSIVVEPSMACDEDAVYIYAYGINPTREIRQGVYASSMILSRLDTLLLNTPLRR